MREIAQKKLLLRAAVSPTACSILGCNPFTIGIILTKQTSLSNLLTAVPRAVNWRVLLYHQHK